MRTRGLVLGGVWLRCITRWRARDLDRELAAGVDPISSDELSLRMGQLGSAGTRVQLASALREAVDLANGRRNPFLTTRLRRPEIHADAEQLLALAERLRDGEPLGVQGVAMTALLVKDSASPLYRPGRSLPAAVSEAIAALDRGVRTASRR